MTQHSARSFEWSALALALLVLGFDAAGLAQGRSFVLGELRLLLGNPAAGSLLLLGIGVITAWFDQQVVSLICIVAALGWAGAGLASDMGSPGGLSAWNLKGTSSAIAACLAIGALIQRVPLPARARFVSSATFLLSGMVVSIITLITIALTFAMLADMATALLGMLTSTAMSILWLDQLIRKHRNYELAARWLAGPIAIAGAVGVSVACWFIAQHDGLGPTRQLWWMIVTAALILWATLATLASSRLAAETLLLRRSNSKRKHMLKRQRGIMHSRTAALRQSRTHYEELFRNVPAPVLLTHPSGEVLAGNPALLELLGVASEEQLKSMNFSTFYADPEERGKLLESWSVSDKMVHQGEVELRRLDGERRNVLYASRVVKGSKGGIDYIQGTFMDISEVRRAEANQRRLEANLRLSQKLESVGRLAAGVAHEINTPMQYIGDNVYFLKESFETLCTLLVDQKEVLARSFERRGVEIAEDLRDLETRLEIQDILQITPGALNRAQEGIETVSRIVAAMKELAHPGDGAKASTDINALIETALTVTRNAYKTVAEVERDLGDIPNALAYKNELCQVFINLIVNAAHAIETSRESGHIAGRIGIRTRQESGSIRICISDNGCGIPTAALDKIFDPFFTTKAVGKGTGQGLALARTTIIDKHGGDISVDSAVGSATTFTITLPLDAHELPACTEK